MQGREERSVVKSHDSKFPTRETASYRQGTLKTSLRNLVLSCTWHKVLRSRAEERAVLSKPLKSLENTSGSLRRKRSRLPIYSTCVSVSCVWRSM